jgi:hypothetical protein
MFLCDGQYLTATLGIVAESRNVLHTQPAHHEIVVILEGEADFRVGDEVRRVGPADLVFIPENTLHGPILRASFLRYLCTARFSTGLRRILSGTASSRERIAQMFSRNRIIDAYWKSEWSVSNYSLKG